jgi:hypothetical protein
MLCRGVKSYISKKIITPSVVSTITMERLHGVVHTSAKDKCSKFKE